MACVCICLSLSGCSDAKNKASAWGEFEGFINGSESAVVDDEVNLGYDDFDCANCGKKYTLNELNDYMINSEYYQHNPTIYAYLMKKDDGNVLLLKYDGMDIYCQDDDSFVIFAITSKDDGFHITYDVESWCRSVVDLNAEGVIESWGSGGAGDHYSDKGFLDGRGAYNEIFSAEECGTGWIGSMFMYNTDVSFSEETINHANKVDGKEENIVTLYTIDGQMYGTVENSDTKAALALVESSKNDGVIWVGADEIDGLIGEYEERIGLKETQNSSEPDWIVIKEKE